MKSLLAFIRKEMLEQRRSGKLIILGILFAVLGIMSPAIAKLTPWLMEMMVDTLAGNGLVFTPVSVSAMDSWTQFFKNMPIGLIAFVLIESSIFTREYQTGTLVLSLTKGLERYKVVAAKTVVLAFLWTISYWLCVGITYGYTAFFWDNAIAQHLLFSLTCWWVFGLLAVALMVLFSAMAKSNTGVLAGTGSVVLGCYLLSFFSRLKKIMPTMLMDGTSLIYGMAEPKAYTVPLIIAAVMIPVCIAVSVSVFNRKQL
ncbi:MAG: ABC transporter permease subunit [Clostridia bacterium]|nr:ABC transporter permease subunit [Clostridia bacterium]